MLSFLSLVKVELSSSCDNIDLKVYILLKHFPEAKQRLNQRFGLTDIQADHIANMTLVRLTWRPCCFRSRGFHFEPIDIYRSDATKFIVTENGLLPPFTSVRGLGETAALDTVEKRKGKDFTSVEEFSLCCNKLSQTHIDQLRALGAFAGLPETSQLTLF